MSLIDRWRTLAGPGPAAEALGQELITRWFEPHRHYHTLEHLQRVLDGVDELAAEADDADAVRYAAWYHDAVYGTILAEAASNEELSARLAETELPTIGVGPERVAEVARLVRLTADHQAAADDGNGSVLCDADLAILGDDEDGYAAYTRAVRAEYASVPDEFFRPGRAAILRDLLNLPTLFRTPTAREHYEERARANLQAELARLEA
jgi:predicted metal-dependent HD superfamily phosphohydrolase